MSFVLNMTDMDHAYVFQLQVAIILSISDVYV